MRIRAVRPDFWQDDTIGHLPDAVRLLYIGLWCVADDAGWLEWRVAQLGATLYPYRPASNRERNIRLWGAQLAAADRIVLHPCGCAFIPTLSRHQRLGGQPTYQYRDKHRRHLVTDDSVGVGSPTPQEVGRGKGREGIQRARAKHDDDDHDEWARRVLETQARSAGRP
jgi:hypothetical protein